MPRIPSVTLNLLVLALPAGSAASTTMTTTVLEFYTTRNCTGAANATVDIAAHNETLCSGCWDKCAHMDAPSYPSMRLRGPGRIAVQGNCVGKFSYAGGWSDASLGGVFSEADGCHNGGASAVVLCSGTMSHPGGKGIFMPPCLFCMDNH
jgi:hypothetical protein